MKQPEPAAVRLHLHRGVGWGLYGTATVVMLVLVLIGTVANVQSGRIWVAAVVAAVGLAVTAFLALVTQAMVVPELTVSAAGVSGRVSRGSTVDAEWDEVTIDVGSPAQPGTIRLLIGAESVSVSAQSWVGFGELIVLVGSTPDATARLTPAARREVLRLLQVEG
jgi:hypothetical protein